MENVLKQNANKFILIGKINGLAGESKKARLRINKAKTQEEVWPLAIRKRIIGVNTRHHLLAYAFLRGTPYQNVEQKCGLFNQPSSSEIFKVIEGHAPSWTPYDIKTKTGGKMYKPTLADVTNWLKSSEGR